MSGKTGSGNAPVRSFLNFVSTSGNEWTVNQRAGAGVQSKTKKSGHNLGPLRKEKRRKKRKKERPIRLTFCLFFTRRRAYQGYPEFRLDLPW